MEKRSISSKKYSDGKQRIVLIRSEEEKVVINHAYDRDLNAQVKVNKNYIPRKAKRYYK